MEFDIIIIGAGHNGLAAGCYLAKSGMKVPNLGLGIGNFLTWLAVGVVFAKLNELMPTLKKIFGVL